MSNIIIFGAGGTGRLVYEQMKEHYNVIGFVDNDSSRWDREAIDSIPVFDPLNLPNVNFDFIALGTFMGCDEIKAQLQTMGIQMPKFYLDM